MGSKEVPCILRPNLPGPRTWRDPRPPPLSYALIGKLRPRVGF
jgi:hypothetical protein